MTRLDDYNEHKELEKHVGVFPAKMIALAIQEDVPKERSYVPWILYCAIIESLGHIGSALIVNAAKYNHIPPDRMDQYLDDLIEHLAAFRGEYRRCYENAGPKIH